MNERILVVDDERGLREGCKRVLVPEGYLVESAESGEEAWQLVQTKPYDLLLIDIKMQGMSGLDLLPSVLQRDGDIVCIIVTGYATLETAVEATKLGAFDFLRKPFTPDELTSLVRKGLEKRKLSLEAKRLREEREQSLLALAAEQSRLRTVINAMSDGVLVANREGTLVLYNPAALRLAAFRQLPSVGCAMEACLSDQGLLARIREEMEAAPAERAYISQETQVGDLSVLASIAPVRDERGRLMGAVILLRDITRLKELDRLKSEFVSLVSHELKAPISTIQSYLETILAGYGSDPEKTRQWLERARERSAAALALIQDLLDISRMESRQVDRQVELLSVADVVLEAAALLKPQADARGLTVKLDLPAGLPRVYGSREELSRLFTNLLSNAIKYNRERGRITVAGAADSAYLTVAVEDTGIGMPADALPRLFSDFYRVKTPETRSITGTGLGLAIVKRIAEAHQGRVTVESTQGKGSTFTVSLPLPVGGDGKPN